MSIDLWLAKKSKYTQHAWMLLPNLFPRENPRAQPCFDGSRFEHGRIAKRSSPSSDNRLGYRNDRRGLSSCKGEDERTCGIDETREDQAATCVDLMRYTWRHNSGTAVLPTCAPPSPYANLPSKPQDEIYRVMSVQLAERARAPGHENRGPGSGALQRTIGHGAWCGAFRLINVAWNLLGVHSQRRAILATGITRVLNKLADLGGNATTNTFA